MTKFSRFLTALAVTPVLMAAAAGAPALAQGMDGDSACLNGGLFGEEFGLCNAYCEAMDCDADTPQASAKACAKVSAKFFDVTGEEPPCEDVTENNKPTLDLNAGDDTPCPINCGATVTFVSFGDAVPIAVNVAITDDGDIIVSATVTLTNEKNAPHETLSLSPAGLILLAELGAVESAPYRQARGTSDVRAGMSAYRRIPDLAPKGAEGRSLTRSRHSHFFNCRPQGSRCEFYQCGRKPLADIATLNIGRCLQAPPRSMQIPDQEHGFADQVFSTSTSYFRLYSSKKFNH